MPDYQQLYQEVILRHQRAPFHFEKREDAGLVLEAYNPVCGDQYKLYLELADGQVVDAHFHGYGCAISKAASSVLCQRLIGKAFSEIQELVSDYRELVSGDGPIDTADEELRAFAAARDFPERLSCATLSWEAVADWLGNG